MVDVPVLATCDTQCCHWAARHHTSESTLQLIPTYTNLTDFEIGGKVLSNTTVTCWSLGIGMLLLVASAFSLYKAFRNWRYNKQLTTEP